MRIRFALGEPSAEILRVEAFGAFRVCLELGKLSAEICGAVRMRVALGEPSAEILRVEAVSLWRHSMFVFFACESLLGTCLFDRALSRVPPAWSGPAPA